MYNIIAPSKNGNYPVKAAKLMQLLDLQHQSIPINYVERPIHIVNIALQVLGTKRFVNNLCAWCLAVMI